MQNTAFVQTVYKFFTQIKKHVIAKTSSMELYVKGFLRHPREV